MKNRKQTLALLTALTCLLALTGCKGSSTEPESLDAALNAVSRTDSMAADDSSSAVIAAELKLTDADKNTAWDSDAVTLTFSGTEVTPSATDGLVIENGSVTIEKGGTYVLSGTLDDGRVIVNLTDKKDQVHLVLNGVSMTSTKSSPLTVLQADKTVITLADGTENTLTDAAEYTEFDETSEDSSYPNACIASKDDLTFNGGGKLTVSGKANNGIACADDLKIVSGNITVTAANHGIRGNDAVMIAAGSVTVQAGGDGIKSSTEDKEGKGDIVIESGSITVDAKQDGIDAAAALTISGGGLNITAGGGSENAGQKSENQMGGKGGFGGQMPDFGGQDGSGFQRPDFGGQGGFGGRRQRTENSENTSENAVPQVNLTANTAENSESSDSAKGIKAKTALNVTGGEIRINSADDAVHSNQTASLTGSAVLTLASGDDGIHADTALTIGGNAGVTVSTAYEGIESAQINITGGTTRVTSKDDGLNASGAPLSDSQKQGFGGMMSNSTGTLNITGGYLWVNAGGDGLDSNGDINMTDGTVVVCGPTNNGNGPLDSGDNGNKITVTGGTLMAVGSTGMMDTPDANFIKSTELNAAADTLIVVTDADGKVLGALKTPKQAQGIVFSANGMKEGYHIYTGGDYTGELNADGFGTGGSYSGGKEVSGNSEKSSGFGGRGGGGFGGRGGRDGQNDGQGGQMTPPDGFDPGNMTPPDGFDPGSMTPPGQNGNGNGQSGRGGFRRNDENTTSSETGNLI